MKFVKSDYEVKLIPNKDSYSFLLEIHYAKRIPSISYCYGLFKKSELVGVVTYGSPASSTIRKSLNLKDNTLLLELNRLCLLDNIKNEASYLISQSIKKLPKNTAIISFADSKEFHTGYVYQACNFIYTGTTKPNKEWHLKSNPNLHSKNVYSLAKGKVNKIKYMIDEYGDDFEIKSSSTKHRYIYIKGNNKLQKEILKKSKSYPKKTLFKSFIYKVTSPSNRVYIGVSNNPKHRWDQHCSDVNSALYPVVNKYGRDALVWEIIYCSYNKDDLYEKEVYFVKEHEAYTKGYNRTEGGDRSGGNFKLTEDEVYSIVHDLKNSPDSIIKISKKYNVSDRCIREINSGLRWSSILKEEFPIRSMHSKAKGSNQGNSILTETIVKNMKKDYMKDVSVSELVKSYGVKKSTVEAILHERNWSHVKVEGYVYKKNNKMSNLDKATVLKIREDYDNGLKITQLERKYGVNRNSVSKIVRRVTWKDI